MADIITGKDFLKKWFVTGAKPTQNQFAAWMDSYWHKNETMDIANVTNLQSVLNSKADASQTTYELSQKVDVEDGKKLSTNDFTDEYKNTLDTSRIDFVNYNMGGNGSDQFYRNADTLYIDLAADSSTGFDPDKKKGLICFCLEAVQDEDNTSATVTFGEEKVMLRWTDANNEIQTRYLYSNTGGTDSPGVKTKLKDIWGNVCLAYFTYDWSGVCILVSAIKGSTTSSNADSVDTITLNTITSSYAITADTASTVKLIAQTTGCSIALPTTLTADKAVTFIIPDSSQAITIDGTSYEAGDTVFCVWDNDELAWSVNNTIQPTVTDYTNVTVKYALTSTNKSYKTTTSRGFKVYQPDTTVAKGDLVAVLSRVNYYGDSQYDTLYGVEQGLYYVAEKETANATSSYCWIKQIAKGTALQIINATTYNEGVWDKTYPGATNSLVTFERLADKANSAAMLAEHVIDLGTSITRTEGKCYFDISASDYDRAMTAGRVVALMRDDFVVRNEGTQDTTVKNGYEPVYVRVRRYVNGVLNAATTLTVPLSLTTSIQAQLKDVYGKALYVVGSLNDSKYIFAIGIQQETEVSPTIIPANAEVIESLTGNYAATKDTADNVSVLNCTSGATFTLPLASTMTEDKNIKLFLSKSSLNSLTIVNVATTYELKAGGYAELFYSADSSTWTVSVTNPSTEITNSPIQGAYEAIKLISSYYQNEGSSSNYHWVKVCTLKDTHTDTSVYAKHVMIFDIFSEGVEHGMGYGSFFYNINDSSYSKFFCMALDFVTQTGYRLTPSDFCVKWSGLRQGTGQVSELWVRLPDNGIGLYFAIRAHGGAGQPKTLTISSSSWDLKVPSEYSATKPTVPANQTHVSIIDCAYSNNNSNSTVVNTSILQANPSSVITINTSRQHLTLKSSYKKNWDTDYYIAPQAGVLEVSGFIEWSAQGGTSNPLNIFLVVGGEQKMLATGSMSATGKVTHIVLCATVPVNANDLIYIDGVLAGNTANISTNSEIKFKITNS